MKISKFSSNRGKTTAARLACKNCLAAVVAVLISLSGGLTLARAQSPGGDVAGATVLTRGPVHEAFAGIVTYNPEPGVVISKAPPAVIEEMPPEERPEGDNITWIPGYWGWDDERTDFLWVSGTWRALPPGREWMAGYWGQTTQGYQWTSGYWADASVQETTYLPAPPVTVEVGPNIAAPSEDYGWTPGCWVWYSGRYAWRPGYWVQGRADWDWCPSYYTWTPRGYIFVGGYWDYPVARRGILFAPVYFESGYHSRWGYSYSPSIVISLNVFSDHLFLRPSYHHYYFGDYYAPSYHQGGFYASFSFHSSRRGYDPIYSHQRWEHRRDRDWEHRVETSYHDRRDNEGSRPPRTWDAQRNVNPGTVDSRQDHVQVATSYDQMTRRKDGPMRFQPVANAERQQLAGRGQEIQKSREQRRTLEAQPVDTAGRAARKPGETIEPAKVKTPRSPIVAKQASKFEKNQAPPKAQQAPKPDPKFQPKAEPSSRQPNVDRSSPQPRRPELERQPAPRRNDTAPLERQVQPRSKESTPKAREESPQEKRGPDRRAQQESERRATDAAVKAREDSQRNAGGLEQKAQQQNERRANDAAAKNQQQSEQRARDSAVKAREDSQRNSRALEQKAQQENERRAQDANVKAQQDSQRNARSLEMKAQQDSAQRAQDSAARARVESQRNNSGAQKQPPRVSEQPSRQRPDPAQKGATQLLKKDRKERGD